MERWEMIAREVMEWGIALLGAVVAVGILMR
jgi:hypothetical protein